MLKYAALGVWVCAVALTSSYVGATWQVAAPASPNEAFLEGIDFEETSAINVPIITNGQVDGYVVAQFVFTADARTLKEMSVPPHAFVLDEALRLIYADERSNFRKLERTDLDAMLKTIREKVNARLGGDIVREVLVKEFNYVSKDQLRES